MVPAQQSRIRLDPAHRGRFFLTDYPPFRILSQFRGKFLSLAITFWLPTFMSQTQPFDDNLKKD